MSWKFPLSDGQAYSIKPQGYRIKWTDTKITSNTNMTISFTVKVTKNIGGFRNIFLLTNKDDGLRMPALYLYDYKSTNTTTSRLHIRWKTSRTWNDGYDPAEFKLNEDQNVEMSWNNSIFIFKLNGKEIFNQSFDSPTDGANNDAYLYIGYYPTDSKDIYITNFQIKDYKPAIQNKVGEWTFPYSVDTWYYPRPNGFVTSWSNTKIRSIQNMVISFSLLITNRDSNWRNIFRITNTNNNCCNAGDRIPALFIWPGQTKLYLRFATTGGGDDGFVGNTQIDLGKEVLIKLIWKQNYCAIIINGKVDIEKYFNTSVPTTTPNTNAYLYISDKDHPSTGYAIKNLKIKDDILDSDRYTLRKSGNLENTWCTGANKTNMGILSLNDCSKQCEQDIDCTGFDITVLSIDFNSDSNNNMLYKCNLIKDSNISAGTAYNNNYGCYTKNNVESQSCSYKLSDAEKICYKNRYPDIPSDVDAQYHWNKYGCKEKRYNQCPGVQLDAGLYKYKGCFKDSNVRDQRIVNTYWGLVNNIDECSELADQNRDNVFAIFDNLNCYTGNNVTNATDPNINIVDKTMCSNNGTNITNQVYVRNPLFPVDNSSAQLVATDFNYSNETFINSESLENTKDINTTEFIKYIIILFIIIILIFLICSSLKSKK